MSTLTHIKQWLDDQNWEYSSTPEQIAVVRGGITIVIEMVECDILESEEGESEEGESEEGGWVLAVKVWGGQQRQNVTKNVGGSVWLDPDAPDFYDQLRSAINKKLGHGDTYEPGRMG